MEFSFLAILVVAALVSLLLTVAKRVEVFSIMVPIFVGLPSALFLMSIVFDFEQIPAVSMNFTMTIG